MRKIRREIFIVAIIVVVILAVFLILTNSSGDNNSENISTVDADLKSVAINIDDVPDNFDFIAEKHWTDPGNFTNATGNGMIWNYIEHYQSNYIENTTSNGASAQNDVTSKIIQSVTKLESKDKAELYVDLWSERLNNKEGYTKINIETIGSKSAYYHYIIPYQSYDIDNYVLCFSIGDVVVTIGGGGLTVNQDTYHNYAKIIEDNVINLCQ